MAIVRTLRFIANAICFAVLAGSVPAISFGDARLAAAGTMDANGTPVLTNPGPQANGDRSASYAEMVLSDAPVAYWRLGEAVGPIAADSAGTNPGTVLGGVTPGQAGALGDADPAMLFNGSTGYVRVANPAALPLTGDLTIEMWINVSLATRQTLISKDYLHEFELTLETTGRLNLYQGNGTAYEGTLSTFGAIAANSWQHVVVTRVAATKTIRFYVNGIPKGSGSYTIAPTSSSKAVYIGRAEGGVQYVNGRLDDVAIYPAALSAAQVGVHYGLRTSTAAATVVSLQLTASDPDGDALTFSALGLPPSLTVNPATGLISGTLSATSAGTYQVTVTASDGTLSHSQTFTWTVTHVNRGPILANPGNRTGADDYGYVQAVLADAAGAYYRLGEATGPTAADSAGTNPGTMIGGIAPGQAGAIGDGNASMLLNGSTGYVRVPDSTALPLAGDLTIEMWINVSLGTRQTLISKDYLHELELTLEASGRLNFYQGNGAAYQGIGSPVGVVTANTWQHVVVTRLAATKTIRFYVNGILKGTGVYTTVPMASTTPISIGRTDGGAQYVNGRLDEVALYPAALGATQIAAHYALRTPPGSGTPVSLQLAASDPDGDPLTFRVTGLPPSLAFNPATGLISGTLSSTSAGLYLVTATASDASLSNTQTFTWTVTHVNRAPVLTSPGNQTGAEGASVLLPLLATDPDGTPLSYSASGLPPSLAINPATGIISGTPSFTSAGTYVVTATVSDGIVANSQTFTWTIANTNRAPVLTNPGNQTGADRDGYVQAVLSDAPAAYWRLQEAAGPTVADRAGINDGTAFGGVAWGQPGALGDGNPAVLFNGTNSYVRAANPAASLSGDLTIEMWINVSLAARQTLISKDYLHELELTLETSGKLNFYQGNGSTYVGFSSVSGAITANTWQHVAVTREAATKTVRFYVNGLAKGSGTYLTAPTGSANAVSIGRSDGGVQFVNGRLDDVALYPAALSAARIANHYALRESTSAGTSVALQLAASDPDNDGLTYGATGLPPSLTVNPATGLISGLLSPTGAGIYQVTATVSDGNISDSQAFTWTVTHLNRAPVLTSPGNQTSAENTIVSLPLVASDPDGTPLTYSASGLPATLTLDAATGLISGTLSFSTAGNYLVTATASDGSLSHSQTFTWTVTNVNRSPVLANPGNQLNAATDGYMQAVLVDAPTAYWRFDQTTGTTAADSSGAGSGAGLSGLTLGGITSGQPGALGDGNPAMLFNGSTGYVRVPSPVVPMAGDITLEMWINVSLAARQTLISKDYLRELELTLETSGRLSFYQGNGTTYQGVSSAPGVIVANAWQHIVVTRESATKTIRFYVNGAARGTGSYVITPTSGPNPLSIGRSDTSGGLQYVNGRLDEVALYPTALSAAQVARHYLLRTATATDSPVDLHLAASDPDSDGLSYSAIGLPAGLTLDASTGIVSGRLAPASAGTHLVTVTASDGSLFDTKAFTWTVTASTPITALTLSADLVAPQSPGTTVTFSVAAAGGSAPNQFKWFLYTTASGWTLLRDWSTGTSYTWTPESVDSGAQVTVWGRSAGNAANAPEMSAGLPYPIYVIARLPFPVSGATLDVSQLLTWTGVAGAQAYRIQVGSTPGGNDLIESGEILETSYDASSAANSILPASVVWDLDDTDPFFVNRYAMQLDGDRTDFGVLQPTSCINPGGATSSCFRVGLPPLAPGAHAIDVSAYNAGGEATAPRVSVEGSGQTVYVRLWTRLAGEWCFYDSQFALKDVVARLVYPVSGAIDVDITNPIRWSNVEGAEAYSLYIGRTYGAADLVNLPDLHTTSYAAPTLPGYLPLYARLGTKLRGHWYYRDAVFSVVPVVAYLRTPADGAVGAQTSGWFAWSSVPGAQSYRLLVGTSQGAWNVLDSGDLHDISYQVNDLPPETLLHARLGTKLNGTWRYVDSVFMTGSATAAEFPLSSFIYPLDGAVLPSRHALFRWTPVPEALGYHLHLGSSPGEDDYGWSPDYISETEFTLSNIPTGTTIYARLYTQYELYDWNHYVDITFTVPTSAPALVGGPAKP